MRLAWPAPADADSAIDECEHDLAVLQASAIPDDLQAATLQSTSGLSPGDFVTAVGFPFGIGPSVSSGVVSGAAGTSAGGGVDAGVPLLQSHVQFHVQLQSQACCHENVQS